MTEENNKSLNVLVSWSIWHSWILASKCISFYNWLTKLVKIHIQQHFVCCLASADLSSMLFLFFLSMLTLWVFVCHRYYIITLLQWKNFLWLLLAAPLSSSARTSGQFTLLYPEREIVMTSIILCFSSQEQVILVAVKDLAVYA